MANPLHADTVPAIDVPDRPAGPMVRTAAALLSVQGVTWVASLIGVSVVPRLLGAGSIGLYGSLAAAIAIASRIAAMGTSTLVTREVAVDPKAAVSLGISAGAVRIIIMSALALPALLAVAVMDREVALVATVMTIAALAALVGDIATCALQGSHSLGRAAVSTSFVQIAGQLVSVAVLMAGWGLMGFILVSTTTSVVATTVVVILFVLRFGWAWTWTIRDSYRLARLGLPFLAWDLGLLFYGSVDFVILPALTGVEMGGNYVFAYRIASIPMFLAAVFVGSVFPTLAASVRDATYFRTVLTRAIGLTLAGTLPMAVGIAILSPFLAETIGGGEFSQATPLIALLSAHIPLAAVDTLLGAAVFAQNRQRTLAVVAWVAAICNPLANLAVIPIADHAWSNGGIGAAAVTVATEGAMAVVLWTMTHQWLSLGELRQTVVQAGAATAVMAVAVVAVAPTVSPFAAIVAGFAVYVLAGVAVGLFSFADVRDVRRALAGGGPGEASDARSTPHRPSDASVAP